MNPLERRVAIAIVNQEVDPISLTSHFPPAAIEDITCRNIYAASLNILASGANATSEEIVSGARHLCSISEAAFDESVLSGGGLEAIPLKSAIENIEKRFLLSCVESEFSLWRGEEKGSTRDIKESIAKLSARLISRIYEGSSEHALVGVENVNILEPPNEHEYVKCHIEEVNRRTGGLARGTVAIITAQTGFGKTAFAIGLTSYVVNILGGKVLYVDMELTPRMIMQRLCSHDHWIPSRSWFDGSVFDLHEDAIMEWDQRVKPNYKQKLKVLSSGPKRIEEIKNAVDRFAALAGAPDVVIVDTFNKIPISRRVDRLEHETECIIELCKIAQKFNCVVVVVAQPSKSEARAGDIDLYSVRGASSLIESAKMVIALTSERAERRESWEYAYGGWAPEEISIVKCTYGQECVVNGVFLGSCYRHLEEEKLESFRVITNRVYIPTKTEVQEYRKRIADEKEKKRRQAQQQYW